MSETVDRQELHKEIEKGTVVVLEALPPALFAEGHLPGARNLPLDNVEEFAPQLVADFDQAIVTYCANDACENSGIAADRLRALGYRRVRTYPGGKQDWNEAGLPLENGVPG